MLGRITSNPARMNGQPCVRDLRLTVRCEYPELKDEDMRQALEFAAAALDDRILDLPRSHETAA